MAAADSSSSSMDYFKDFIGGAFCIEDVVVLLSPRNSPPPSLPVQDFLSIISETTSPPPKDFFCTFLETYPTPLHSSPASYCDLRVFWSHDDRQLIIQDKIRCAFQNLQAGVSFGGLIQFWAPVYGTQLLTTYNQPFTLAKLESYSFYGGPGEYRLCSLNYRYNVDVYNLQFKDDPTILSASAAPARAFLDQMPELLLDLRCHVASPLISSALGCGLMSSVVVPVFDPSQSGCAGVIECSARSSSELLQVFNDLNIALEKQGLKTFHARDRLPLGAICGLEHAMDEINEALKIIWHTHSIASAHVWTAYEDENHSSLEDSRAKRILGLKLVGHSFNLDDKGHWEDYGTACYKLPLKMEEGLAGKTLENYEPHFIQSIRNLCDNRPQWLLLSTCFDCNCLVIYLRSTTTGDLDYVFEFLWTRGRGDCVILWESLLLTLERCLPNFKFASGVKLGDEIDILDVENSTESENKYIKIFQTNKLSLKRGRQPKVEECSPLKAKGKTTPIILSPERIESQFGQTLEEAAPKLKVSVSTLKRKCKYLGIKWQGKDCFKKNQSDTNEEDKGGAIQDNIGETSSDENMVTIKVEYAGDVIKFTLPISSATFEAIQKEIGKKFKVGHVAHYKLKYFDHDDNEWILFTCDEDVTLCTKNKRNVQLCLLPRQIYDPSHTYQLT